MAINEETLEEMHEAIARDYGIAQQMLREVGMHWSGRQLVDSVREAVDEIKNLRTRLGIPID